MPGTIEPRKHLHILPLIQRQSFCGRTDDGTCTNLHANYSTIPQLDVQGVTKLFATTMQESDSQDTANYSPSRFLSQDLSFTVAPGDLVLVKGSSGSGKSTLLRGLAGLLPLDKGNLLLGATNWDQNVITAIASAEWRRQTCFVAQAKVDIPGTPLGMINQISKLKIWQHTREQNQEVFVEKIKIYLEDWKVVSPETALNKPWSQLSGGEAQRIFIAITLASRPSVILFDESASALDKISKMAVERSVIEFVLEGISGVLWISHDEDQASRMATSS